MAQGVAVQTEEAAAGQRTGHHPRDGLVPPVVVERHGIDEAALNFVGDGQREEEVPAARTEILGHRKHPRQVVGGMAAVDGAVGVVDVEVPEHHPVGERRHFGGCPCERAEHACTASPGDLGRQIAGDADRLRRMGGQGASDGVDHPALGLMQHRRRQLVETKLRRIVDHCPLERAFHSSSSPVNQCPWSEFLTTARSRMRIRQGRTAGRARAWSAQNNTP